MAGVSPFLRVSSRPVLYAGRDSWKSSARRREAPRESAYRLQAPSALIEPSQIVRCGLKRPAFQMHQFPSQHDQGSGKPCHEFITSRPAHTRRRHPCHTRYCHLPVSSSKHPRRSTHNTCPPNNSQGPAAIFQRPARPVPSGEKRPDSALASRSILSSRFSQDSGVQRRCVPDLRTHHSLLL
jgi:hypothetical protein